MEQTTFEQSLQTFQAQCSPANPIADLSVTPGNTTAPIVVLVHGIGGNAHHWADPTSLNPNDTWLFDINTSPSHDPNGIRTSPPYATGSVRSWTQTLGTKGVTYINFTQVIQDDDLIQYPVAQLVAIFDTLEKTVFALYDADVAANGGTVPPLIILCHSRGGLVTRHALKQLGKAGLPHLRKVITLSTPHYGSYMPKLSADYNNGLSTKFDFSWLGAQLPGPLHSVFENTIDKYLNSLSSLIQNALSHSFGSMATSAGFAELIPGSPMLQALEAGEQPLEGVEYHGFAGTQPAFVNVFLCELGQSVHILSVSSQTLIDMLAKAGILNSYGGLAELSKGDSAVAVSSSYWPPAFNASHQEFGFNHMQALIDQSLQNAVIALI